MNTTIKTIKRGLTKKKLSLNIKFIENEICIDDEFIENEICIDDEFIENEIIENEIIENEIYLEIDNYIENIPVVLNKHLIDKEYIEFFEGICGCEYNCKNCYGCGCIRYNDECDADCEDNCDQICDNCDNYYCNYHKTHYMCLGGCEHEKCKYKHIYSRHGYHRRYTKGYMTGSMYYIQHDNYF